MGSQSNKQLSAKDDAIDIVTKPFGTAAVVIIGIIALAFGLFISIARSGKHSFTHSMGSRLSF
ncbi:hypothetical protein OE903_21205 [Bacillus sp. B6(2022)]|nr:hypothetical protein [Bacillus sp. B6(2022)]